MENSIELNENDLKVMSCMFDTSTQQGLSKTKGVTLEDIKGKLESFSEASIRHSIKKLLATECIGNGIKKGRRKTYHITQEGLDYVATIKKPVVQIINK